MSWEVLQGDCREVMRGMDENSVDAIVTSPPYDNLRTYNDRLLWGQSVWESVIEVMYNVVKPGGVVVWVVGDATIDGSETGSSFKQALYAIDKGFLLHDTMIWDKGSFTATGSLRVRYASVFEYMFVFSKGKPKTFNPIKDRKTKREGHISSGTIRQPDGSTKKKSPGKPIQKYCQRFNIWSVPGARKKCDRVGHPAPMPISIALDHIKSWTNEGDIVLDPFAGGGTTGVACQEAGRSFIGIELDEQYADIARQRIGAAEQLGVA